MGIFYSSQEPSSQEPSSQEPSKFINQSEESKCDDAIENMISKLQKLKLISKNDDMGSQHNFSENEIQFDLSMIIIVGIPEIDISNTYELLYLEPTKCFGVLLPIKIYEYMKASLSNFSASFCGGCEDVFLTSNFYQLVGENIPQNGNSVPFDTSSPDWLYEGRRDCNTDTDNFVHWWEKGKPIIDSYHDPNDNKFVFHVDKNGMVTLTICHGGLIRNPTDSYDLLLDQLENDNLDEPSNNNYINYADFGPLIYKGNNNKIITFTLGKIPNIKILSSCGIIIETYKTM